MPAVLGQNAVHLQNVAIVFLASVQCNAGVHIVVAVVQHSRDVNTVDGSLGSVVRHVLGVIIQRGARWSQCSGVVLLENAAVEGDGHFCADLVRVS